MNILAGLTIFLILSTLVEGIIENLGAKIPSQFKPYVAAVLGAIICFFYRADILAFLGLPSVPYLGPILTGLIVGRGSNYVNDFVSKLRVVTAPAQAVASIPQPTDTPPRL